MSYTKHFNWLLDPQHNEKIFNARLDAEFDDISTASNHISITQASATSGTVAGPLNWNEINVTNQAGVTGSVDAYGLTTAYNAALKVTLTEGGPNAKGFQVGQYILLKHTIAGPSNIGSISAADHVGQVVVCVSDQTATAGAGGGLYGTEVLLQVLSGGSHDHVVAHNPSIGMAAGSAANYVAGVRIQHNGTVHGATSEGAITLAKFDAGEGWANGILINELSGGSHSIATTGNIMSAANALTIANAFNLSNVTITGNVLATPHAVLTGAGALAIDGALTYGGVTLTAAVTGTGKMVLDTGPTLSSPALGTPASGVLTNCTGLPYSSLVSAIYGSFYLSSNQGYTATAAAKVNIDTAEINQGLTFDGVTFHRVTIITAGKYLVMYSVYVFGLTAGDLVTGRIKKNGTTDQIIGLVAASTTGGQEGAAVGSKVISLAVNDYLEIYATASHNGTIGGAPTLSFLSLQYIGP